MFAHVFAITLADCSCVFNVFSLVGNVDYQPGNVRRFAAGRANDRHDILQRLVKLFDKIVTDDLVFVVPCDLAGDEE
jgi:hypothetical protein